MIFVARKLDENRRGLLVSRRHVVENPERDVVGGCGACKLLVVVLLLPYYLTASVELLPVLIGL